MFGEYKDYVSDHGKYYFKLGDERLGHYVRYQFKNKDIEVLPEDLTMPSSNEISCLFCNCTKLKNIDALKNWDIKEVKDLGHFFSNCESLENVDALSKWDTGNVKFMDEMFWNCKSLKNINGLRNWNVENLKMMQLMFCDCESLRSIEPLQNWKITNKIKSIDWSFSNCYGIRNAGYIKDWYIPENMSYDTVFSGCSNLRKRKIRTREDFMEYLTGHNSRQKIDCMVIDEENPNQIIDEYEEYDYTSDSEEN